jgi:predicted ATPase
MNNTPLCLFVDGKAGRGKTMLVNTLCDKIRSLGKIVIPTATAAFAAQLYPGGRTTHSAFKVSILDGFVSKFSTHSRSQ